MKREEPIDSQILIISEGEIGQRPSWDEYFMAQAINTSKRSSCENVEAGSVITIDNRIKATGYNGAAPQYENCLEIGCRKKAKGLDYETSLGSGECEGVHAEMNALGHLDKTQSSPITLYTTLFPCHSCAKNLMPYNLQRVVFKSFYADEEFERTLDYFKRGNVEVARLNLSPARVLDIIFSINKKKFNVWDPEDQKEIKKLIEKMQKK